MAYRRSRRTSGRRVSTRAPRRRTTRRRSVRRTSRTQRIVIQVVGGQGGVATSPVTIGMKAASPLRARY